MENATSHHQSEHEVDRPRIAVVGDGQMGLASAIILATKGYPVTLWGHRPEHVNLLATARESRRHFPGFTLPPLINVTPSDKDVFQGVEFAVQAVPTQFIRPVFSRLARHIPPNLPIVSQSKGIENDTLLRPTQILSDVLDHNQVGRPLAVMTGPGIAGELAAGLPSTLIVASNDPDFALRLQEVFTTDRLRIYTRPDLLGIELAGALKNVIALAAGCLDGFKAGYNAKSALLARGLAEMARLGVAMGASADTFFGIAGVGDLATTCFCPEGRNRWCGEQLGKGRTLQEVLASTDSIVEGVATTRSVIALARRYRVEMPIAQAVYAVLYENMNPRDALRTLMTREVKTEKLA